MLLLNPSQPVNFSSVWTWDGWLAADIDTGTAWLAATLPLDTYFKMTLAGRLQSQNFYLISTPSLCIDNSLNCVSVNLTPVCPVSTSCAKRERERELICWCIRLWKHSKPSSRLRVTDPPLQDKRNQCSPLKITCLVIDCSPPTSTHTNVW